MEEQRPHDSVVRRNMPELDTLRGVAILLVFLYHGLFWSVPAAALTANATRLAAPFRYGWSGVQLFFILSGFLITGILLRTREGERFYRSFYIRRALRILPAFVLLIAVLLASRAITWKYALLSLAFGANFAALFGLTGTYPVLWSLAVEEQFYAVWPAAVRRLSVHFVAGLAVLVFLGSPVIRMLAFRAGTTEGIYFYTWFNLDGLALGALLAVIARGSRRAFANAFAILGSLAIIALAAAALRPEMASRKTAMGAALQSTSLYLIYGCILAGALLAGSSRWRAFVQWRPLQWLGNISYGLYLVHLACFGLFDRVVSSMNGSSLIGVPFLTLRFAIAGGIAIGIAAASRRYYESYFLAMKGPLTGEAAPSANGDGTPVPLPSAIE